jgi:hypothetical protein
LKTTPENNASAKKPCPDPESHERGDILFPCDHHTPKQDGPSERDRIDNAIKKIIRRKNERKLKHGREQGNWTILLVQAVEDLECLLRVPRDGDRA